MFNGPRIKICSTGSASHQGKVIAPTPATYLSGLAVRQYVAIFADDLHLHAGQNLPATARLCVSGHIRSRHRARRLGHAPKLTDLYLQLFLRFTLQCRSARSSGREKGMDAVGKAFGSGQTQSCEGQEQRGYDGCALNSPKVRTG